MEERWCSACGGLFHPRPQCPGQSYCSKDSCQKVRKLLWQRIKRRSDPDYVANQAKANSAWTKRNPEYWRRYRARRAGSPLDDGLIAMVLGGSSTAPDEDASSGTSGSGSTGSAASPIFLVDLELGAHLVLRMSIRLERVERGHKSSSGIRKETTR